jgi:hypothetical protein
LLIASEPSGFSAARFSPCDISNSFQSKLPQMHFAAVYPLTETPEKEITANPRTGCPKNRAGSKSLFTSKLSI